MLDGETVFRELGRVGSRQAGELRPCCVDVQVAVRAIVPAETNIGAGGWPGPFSPTLFLTASFDDKDFTSVADPDVALRRKGADPDLVQGRKGNSPHGEKTSVPHDILTPR